MKRLLLSLLLLVPGVALAGDPVTINRSSFTQTNDFAYIPAAYLDHIIIGVATAGGTITVYNSTWTKSVVISSISLGTVFSYDFSNLAVTGIYYVTNTATNGVEIVYKK